LIRAVLDANVLVSGIVGFLVPASTPGELLRLWRDGAFVLIVSEPILSEVGRTLSKPYFRRRLTDEQVAAALRLLREEATQQPITVSVSGVATQPEDDLILATAASAQADYLVSGDDKLQRLGAFQGVTILSPRAFLQLLDQPQPS
jgi:putative PIN family toxin of toxin-antitoxin system